MTTPSRTQIKAIRAQLKRRSAAGGGMVVCMSCLSRFHERWMIPAGTICEFTGRDYCINDDCMALAASDHRPDCPFVGQ